MNEDYLNNNPTNEGQGGMLPKDEYAAKKKQERDDIFTLSDTTAMSVANDGGKFQQFLDVQSSFSRYSAVNALLVLAQKPKLQGLPILIAGRIKAVSSRKGKSPFLSLSRMSTPRRTERRVSVITSKRCLTFHRWILVC